MKYLKYSILALICVLFASCMGEDYAEIEKTGPNKEPVYTNLITIKQLKEKYTQAINGNGLVKIDDDIQIQGVVTGNDIESNIYGQISLQDETGALLICITAPNLFTTLPVGQEILVDLKGLMIGGYGQMPEVGGVYTNTNPSSSSYGQQSIGRLSRYEWEKHYTLIGTPDASKAEPMEFDLSKVSDSKYLEDNCGKLMTIKNVVIKEADGKAKFAPRDGSVEIPGNAANRTFKGINSNNLVLRTSVYAQFAGNIMPEEAIDVTGIFTRYRNTWQIMLRSINDIKPAEVFNIDDLPGTGLGTAESPMNVERALALVESGNNDPAAEVYVAGIISQIDEVSTQFGNATYYISDDGKDAKQLQVYRGYAINGDKFSDETKDLLQLGKKVVIAGKLVLYKETIEFTAGSKIISIE